VNTILSWQKREKIPQMLIKMRKSQNEFEDHLLQLQKAVSRHLKSEAPLSNSIWTGTR
jgi:hypothetical protein